METIIGAGPRGLSLALIASFIRSGINGNTVIKSALEDSNYIASFIRSGINGNLIVIDMNMDTRSLLL